MSLPQTPYKNRLRQFTSASPTQPFSPPIGWVQVISTGDLVMKDEDGTAVTFTAVAAGDVIPGPFSEFTSTTSSKIRLGDGPSPRPSPSVALAELYTNAASTQGMIPLPPQSFYLLTGAPLAVFADGTTTVPGSSFDGSKSFGVRWNNDAAPAAITASFQIPPDMDITANATFHGRIAKTGATNNAGNTTTLAVGLFSQADATLYDADTDFGGTSSALLPAATAKTIQNVTLTLALADLAAYPASATITIKPTAGTLNTDDLVFVGACVVYKKKLLTS